MVGLGSLDLREYAAPVRRMRVSPVGSRVTPLSPLGMCDSLALSVSFLFVLFLFFFFYFVLSVSISVFLSLFSFFVLFLFLGFFLCFLFSRPLSLSGQSGQEQLPKKLPELPSMSMLDLEYKAQPRGFF